MRKKSFLVNFKNRENNKGTRNNPTHFLFFDTETKQEDTIKKIGKKEYRTIINKLDFGYACYWNRETNEEEWYRIDSIKGFHNFLGRCIKKARDNTLWCIAHNIVFDNFILDMWGYFEKSNWIIDFIHAKGMVYLQSFTKKTGNKVRNKVMLINNGNIFPETLATIGETIGIEKMEIDFNKIDTYSRQYFEEYGKRDVVILLEFWKQWANFIEDNDLGKLKYTISSQSMESYKHKFCNSYILLDDNLDILDFERKAYYGGRTEIFYKGKIRKPVWYYDVNAMYPFVMKNKRFPIEYKYTKENMTVEQLKYYIDTGWLVVGHVTIETEKNNLYPTRENNTLMFPVGKFQTYLCTPEILKAIEYGDLKEVHEVKFYTGDYIFTDYVDYFYNKRLELKKVGNKQEVMYKLFLNSLYGKFGQLMDVWVETSIEEIQILDPDFDFDSWIMDDYKIPKILIDGVNITPKLRYIGGQLQLRGEVEESNISFPAIAGHVTSYARLIIWEGIKNGRENKSNIYYCDTDSLFTDTQLPDFLVDSKELGKFKVEKIFEHGVEFINLKNYCGLNENGNKIIQDEEGNTIEVNDEVFLNESKLLKGKNWVMKGVRQDAEVIDENTFIAQEWGGLPKQEYYTKFGRQKGEFWVIYKTKRNHGTIRKGTVQKDGKINPFVIK